MDELFRPGKQIAYFIYRATTTIKGVTYRAKDYGKRAFRIPVYK